VLTKQLIQDRILFYIYNFHLKGHLRRRGDEDRFSLLARLTTLFAV
jgi:hypothetical protein